MVGLWFSILKVTLVCNLLNTLFEKPLDDESALKFFWYCLCSNFKFLSHDSSTQFAECACRDAYIMEQNQLSYEHITVCAFQNGKHFCCGTL